jgi:dUTP pyrophosphatase
MPEGYEAQKRPINGLASKNGITIINSPGTIDADYRGEVYIIMVNLSEDDFVIKDGERNCQRVISKHEKAEWINVNEIMESACGTMVFRHTCKI